VKMFIFRFQIGTKVLSRQSFRAINRGKDSTQLT
jgi:hypothetical protein